MTENNQVEFVQKKKMNFSPLIVFLIILLLGAGIYYFFFYEGEYSIEKITDKTTTAAIVNE